MFDPITSALIASSPQLSGLDLQSLPKRLTEAYAEIVAARIEFRGQPGATSERLTTVLAEMRRLAAAQEAFVALEPDRGNRNAAAFVAASAHQVRLLATPSGERAGSYLDGTSVAPEVCASLLFLVAEAHADAAECAKQIVIAEERANSIDGVLLQAIRLLCQGHLNAIRRLELPALREAEGGALAVEALYLTLLKGVQNLATRLLSRVDTPVDAGGVEQPRTTFGRVKELSVGSLGDVLGIDAEVYSLFPGPLHLASLLLAADRDLIANASSRIMPPNGISEDAWWPIIRQMARRRPYLWRNHKQAIEAHFLDIGVSSALSFPTGGGKSTLAELKIATALLRDKKVIFLVPTHALVDQTTRALKRTFNTFEIVGDIEDDASAVEFIALPEVVVTTPERCLVLLSSQPAAFADLGLVVFDECHLLHPREPEKSRRSVDAMLAVLNLARAAPAADFLLLSAMMKNAEEVAAWMTELTGRQCLHLDLAWKPTRQVRGCVVYPSSRIDELNAVLRQARIDRPKQKNAPAAVQKTLAARPFGLFSLLQTWATQDRNDYALLPLLNAEHHFSTGAAANRRWYLTPNGNHTSALIAAGAAASGMKTLVFVQTVPQLVAAARDFRKLVADDPVVLNDDETALRQLVVEEMGGPSYCYLALEPDGRFAGGAVTHHSLLLREERLLHESLFKRRPGANVLFATSTVAQGMNLPSEVVIISGDSRFDPAENKFAQLEAHELLNAAGRAGRAGESSQGFVLVVPSRVVPFDDKTSSIGGHWMKLQAIFSQSDQCVDIDDPLTALLDAIHAGIREGMPLYLLNRLPPASPEGTDAPLRSLVERSFGAFRAKQKANAAWVESRIASTFQARSEHPTAEADKWIEGVGALTGVPAEALREIADLFANNDGLTTQAAMDRLLSWLAAKPGNLMEVLRPENVAELFGGEFEKLQTGEKRVKYALPVIASLLHMWMAGRPLCEMEALHPNPDSNACRHARHFVLRLVPDLAFLAGLPARLLQAKAGLGASVALPTALASLGSAVKEGCDSPETLAARINDGRAVSRVSSRQRFMEVVPYITPASANEPFQETRQRVRNAVALKAFSTPI